MKAAEKAKMIKQRWECILHWFKENKPLVETELHYTTPFELLVAVILSAQCTDKRVNITTPKLFKAYPSAKELANAKFEDVLDIIKSISYPNNKAKHLIAMAQKLVNDFQCIVPDNIEDLTSLPGVGRKTANVVASIIYDKPVIAVDTHVFRVSKRLGLSEGKTVEAVEKDLTECISPQDRSTAHHWLILHGRYICTARKPHCEECPLTEWCQDFITKNLKLHKTK